MVSRRSFLLSGLALGAAPLCAQAAQAAPGMAYDRFLDGIRAEASRRGISGATLDRALGPLTGPNPDVIKRDRHQPEFTMTWSQYRSRVLTDTKISNGQKAYSARAALLQRIWERYQVDPGVVAGIWGMESAYGVHLGKFGVVDALATLAYEGRRARFFRSQLMNALKILEQGDITPENMLGSYAGAMGQPQFMPDSYLRYAVDFDGDGRRDIWTSETDVLASIANYLSSCGWDGSAPWGQEVRLPGTLAQSQTGRTHMRPLSEWDALGVRRLDGGRFSRMDVQGAVICPDGVGGDAFMVYHNFNVIRRYNPSDYYALGVGILGSSFA